MRIILAAGVTLMALTGCGSTISSGGATIGASSPSPSAVASGATVYTASGPGDQTQSVGTFTTTVDGVYHVNWNVGGAAAVSCPILVGADNDQGSVDFIRAGGAGSPSSGTSSPHLAPNQTWTVHVVRLGPACPWQLTITAP